MSNIVVTGATSMIGVALINSIIKNEKDVKIYAVIKPGSRKIERVPVHDSIVVILCDVEDYSNLPNIINEQCDIFYHLAWPRTDTYDENYIDIIQKVNSIRHEVEAVNAAYCLGCKKFVGAGTQAEYGVNIQDVINENSLCNPVRADGIAHLAAGKLAKIVADKYNMVCIWTRIFSVYGINDRENSMISITINKLIKQEHCSFSDAEQVWDYIYEDDIGDALYLLGKKCEKSKVYCVANGNALPLKEYIDIIKEVVDPSAELGYGEISLPNNPIMNLEVDVSRLKADVGWVPKVEFSDGIKKIYEHILNNENDRCKQEMKNEQ